jgi:hypothetical protein
MPADELRFASKRTHKRVGAEAQIFVVGDEKAELS